MYGQAFEKQYPGSGPLPWGPWATALWTPLFLLPYFIVPVGLGILVAAGLAAGGRSFDPRSLGALESNGLFLSISSLVSACLGIGLIVIAIRIRSYKDQRMTVTRYLRLRSTRWRSFFKWLGVMILYLVLLDSVSYWLGRPLVPEFMVEAYRTARIPLLFWAAIVIGAPLYEEILFRGFLLEGYVGGRVRTILAAVLISALWAVIHFQYGWYEIIWIFGLGLLFSAARVRSGSLWTPILLHMLCNFAAMLQTQLAV